MGVKSAATKMVSKNLAGHFYHFFYNIFKPELSLHNNAEYIIKMHELQHFFMNSIKIGYISFRKNLILTTYYKLAVLCVFPKQLCGKVNTMPLH